jgi:hypothetical protein
VCAYIYIQHIDSPSSKRAGFRSTPMILEAPAILAPSAA